MPAKAKIIRPMANPADAPEDIPLLAAALLLALATALVSEAVGDGMSVVLEAIVGEAVTVEDTSAVRVSELLVELEPSVDEP
jgi:hypothetical protein